MTFKTRIEISFETWNSPVFKYAFWFISLFLNFLVTSTGDLADLEIITDRDK